ncbi:hypothetical protein [Paenibacillus sp. FSL R7-0331]|uniref:hypothetical protein n=1 Tax=Paenibacillus sp. FSL R7-0331 TaxID=1536773 RepID=UPI0004F81FC5|nr:hypothetical protein [Paenibacillus sp. FSL R7-0331]AIQ54059.1 hypothetical protein R70331_22680 [Paenibacillus sp. FSL R7-0331]
MRKSTFLSTILFSLIIGFVTFDHISERNKPADVVVYGSHAEYDYDDIVNRADVVALIKVNDELTKDNSTIVYLENSPLIKYHYASREAEVLEYYKNDLGLKDNIKFNEPVAITPNNEYIHSEEYIAFEKDQKYIVFLSKDNGLNELSIIASNNGKVDLQDFSNNEYQDVAIRSVLHANGIEIPQDSIINYDLPQKKAASGSGEQINNNKYFELPINHYVDQNSQIEYFNIQGIPFSIEKNE